VARPGSDSAPATSTVTWDWSTVYLPVCGALDAAKFQESFGLRLVSVSGPKQSTTREWLFEIE